MQLGAPVARERIYFLILRGELIHADIDNVGHFINVLHEELQSESQVTWCLRCILALPCYCAGVYTFLFTDWAKARPPTGPKPPGSPKRPATTVASGQNKLFDQEEVTQQHVIRDFEKPNSMDLNVI